LVVYALAKAGVPDITVYDPDIVESHNVPMSLYRPSDIGRPKVEALAERIAFETDGEIMLTTHAERLAEQPLRRGSLIACIDRMDDAGAGRIPLFERVAGSLAIDLFIDTRIHRWFGEVYSIVPTLKEDCERYRDTLFPDSEMELQVCGFHGIGSMSMAVAGDAVNALFRYWNEGTHEWRGSRRYDRLPSA
jgi:molybdopterin/thiamine biosynthesis adenylyltransferase